LEDKNILTQVITFLEDGEYGVTMVFLVLEAKPQGSCVAVHDLALLHHKARSDDTWIKREVKLCWKGCELRVRHQPFLKHLGPLRLFMSSSRQIELPKVRYDLELGVQLVSVLSTKLHVGLLQRRKKIDESPPSPASV